MARTVTWLHLSDLHSRPSQSGWDARRITQRLIEDLKRLSNEENLRPDFIFFSGDAAWGEEPGPGGSLTEQFQDAHQFLESVRGAFSPAIEQTRVHLVPGNHDINRANINRIVQPQIANIRLDDFVKWCRDDSVEWQDFMRRLVDYRTFLRDHGYTHLLADESRLNYAIQHECNGAKVGILGLNSAWSSYGGDDEKGDMRLIGRFQMETLLPSIENCDIRIALTHHPFSWFRGEDDFSLKREVRAAFHFLLHGHEHSSWVDESKTKSYADGRRHTHVTIQGGACYQGSAWPNGYNIVSLDLDSGKGKVFLRDYSAAGGGGWTALLVPDEAPNGVWEIDCPTIPNTGNVGVQEGRTGPDSVGEGILDALPLVQVDRPTDMQRSSQKLRGVPRLLLHKERQHDAIRKLAKSSFANAMKADRKVWLVSDWRHGHEAFLASALSEHDEGVSCDNVFRLQCGDAASCADLWAAAETQVGMAILEFLAAVAAIPDGVLFFDDLPARVVVGPERSAFEQRIKEIRDFCPQLSIILGTRLRPVATSPESIVELHPLDPIETRLYLARHPKGETFSFSEDEVEHICQRTGGLPVHIDRIVERWHFVELRHILNDADEPEQSGIDDTVPQSLKNAIEALRTSERPHSQRSYFLLKLLTILRDGETFESVWKFDPRKPFHSTNVSELVSHGLLTTVPVSRSVVTLNPLSGQSRYFNPATTGILFVPRHVRDFVNSITSEADRASIVSNSTTMLFGPNWRVGKIALRRTLSSTYGESALVGPGNEHIIARYLLQEAMTKKRRFVDRYATLACGYCQRLLAADRFRDAYIASAAIYDLLKGSEEVKHFVDISHVYGKALRMIGRKRDAIPVVKDALAAGSSFLIPDNEASMHLTLAYCYQSDDPESARREVAEVNRLVHPHSSDAYHAAAILADLDLDGRERIARLEILEHEARNRKHSLAANNIALDLACEGDDPVRSLRFLDRVLLTAKDNYNRTRAIIEKASVVSKHRMYSEFSEAERQLLNAAYSYSYAQRIGNLVDRCHRVLWTLFTREKLFAPLARLFRFSSFTWRVGGNETKEIAYLKEIKAMDLVSLIASDPSLEMEVVYVSGRLRDAPSGEIDPSDSSAS